MKTNMSKKKIATGRMRRLPVGFHDMAEGSVFIKSMEFTTKKTSCFLDNM